MLRHKTTVITRQGPVLVSTTPTRHGPGERKYYETLVVPFKTNGDPQWGTELARAESEKPKKAKRTHREFCQQFDLDNREFTFEDKEMAYVPVGTLPLPPLGPRGPGAYRYVIRFD